MIRRAVIGCGMSSPATSGPIVAVNARQPIEVCITIDTEFSIGGAFRDPERHRPLSNELVDCTIGNSDHGLGFLLKTLGNHNIPATFFVEALQTHYFGETRMGRIAEQIAGAGHDVQLHLHPCWQHFTRHNWRSLEIGDDSCSRRSVDALQEMIEFAFDVFKRWGVPRPTALRAGNFHCSRTVHQAMVRCGMALGSNIALGAYGSSDPELWLASGCDLVNGVLEVAALTYQSLRPPVGTELRPLAITATSWPETEALLWRAWEADISPVVVLTHPFEFIKRDDFRYQKLYANHINQRRLERLLSFLASHADEFTTTTFGGSGAAWIARGSRPGGLLQVPRHLAFARSGQNLLNNLLRQY